MSSFDQELHRKSMVLIDKLRTVGVTDPELAELKQIIALRERLMEPTRKRRASNRDSGRHAKREDAVGG